jgi:hypothetical protein
LVAQNSSYEAQGIHASQSARILGVEGQTGIDLIFGDLAPAVPFGSAPESDISRSAHIITGFNAGTAVWVSTSV